MIQIKGGPDGARIAGLGVPALLALVIASEWYEAHGQNCVLTSGTEGKHKAASLHYVGQALDLRMPSHPESVVPDLKDRLGDDYDVVVEGDHLHIEFQPKRGVNLAA